MTATSRATKVSTISNEVKELHPLLSALLPKLPNVEHVEYTHGQSELGADFVLRRKHSTLGTPEVVGVIAKLGRIVQNLDDVTRQIEECEIPRAVLGSREKVRLSEVWVIATGTITAGAKEKIQHKFALRSIQFLDGAWLERLIEEHIPDYWLGVDLGIYQLLSGTRETVQSVDSASSLVPMEKAEAFYIEQDIFEAQPLDYDKTRRHRRDERVIIWKEVERHSMLVVEGGMGAGKSKLLRRIALHYSKTEVFRDARLIPILMSCKQLTEVHNGDINAAIEATAGSLQGDGEEAWSAVFLLDGLDEVNLDIDQQGELLASLAAQATAERRVVLATRYLENLPGIIAGLPVKRLELRPLSLSRVLEFMRAICNELNLASRLVEDLKRSQLFNELPRSPIAAILLGRLLAENSKDLPSNLTELYSKFSELVLGRWDVDRGLRAQVEYEVLDSFVMELAEYLVDHELPSISVGEALEMLGAYLGKRHLPVEGDQLFGYLLARCELLSRDRGADTISFRHRTFAEFYCARSKIRSSALPFGRDIFTPYWRNIYFFYVGLQRDAPGLLKKLRAAPAESHSERFLKIFDTGSYLLAGYRSPYSVVTECVRGAMVDAAQLYLEETAADSSSIFSKLPAIQVLYLFQLLARISYSYDFFLPALEEVMLDLASASDVPMPEKAYAMFFTNVAYVDAGGDQGLDFLIRELGDQLPVDLLVGVSYETGSASKKTTLMRKQDRRLRKMLRSHRDLAAEVDRLHKRPRR